MFWSTITLNNRTNRFVCGPRYLTPQVCVINYLYNKRKAIGMLETDDTHIGPHMANHDPFGEVMESINARRKWAYSREGAGCWYCLLDLIMAWCDLNNSEWLGNEGVRDA